MFKFVRIILILLAVLETAPAVAQMFGTGLEGSGYFRRQLDAFQWEYNGVYLYDSERFQVSITDRFQSRLFYLSGRAQNIQDQNQALLLATGWLNPALGITTEARSLRFTTTGLRQDILLAGIAWAPAPGISIRPMAGIMSDARSGNLDQGASFVLRGDADPIQAGDLVLSPGIFVEYADIDPRTHQTYRLLTDLGFQNEDIRIRAKIQLGTSIRDSYQASSFLNRNESDFIESIRNDSSMISLSFSFPLAGNISGLAETGIVGNRRRITNNTLVETIDTPLFDTKNNRLAFDFSFTASYPVNRSLLSAGFVYTSGTREARLINTDDLPADQVRRRSEILLNSNFDQQRVELFTQNRIRLSDANTLNLLGRTSILRHDTPDLNADDRDEFFAQVRISDHHRFSNDFSAGITFAGEAYHYVYLFAERSIENNWRRSLRLIPEFEWNPWPWFTLRQQMLLRANYTVEDFEIEGRLKNDQASREFAFQSDIKADLDSEWSLETGISRNELRIGRLLWKEFREVPIDTLITWEGYAMLVHNRPGGARIAAGLRGYRKIDFIPIINLTATAAGPAGQDVNISRIAPGRQITSQWGPAVEVMLPLYHRNELYINGWWQFQSVGQRLYTQFPEEFRDAFRRAERRRSTRVYPNLEIRTRIFF
ncbi:MAG: hypothetical protein ACNA8K_03630 [Cyclonatronaceae bacterium]